MSENALLFEKKASSGSGSLSFRETTDGSGIGVMITTSAGATIVSAFTVLREPEAEILSVSLSNWCAKKQREETE